MIKNKMKSAISVVIVFALLVVTASAAVIQPRWTYIASSVSSLDISDSGYATLYGGGSAPSPNVNKVKAIVELQQFKNSKWETLNTWTATASGWSARTSTKTWPVAHGYSYRLYVTLEAYNGSTLLESASQEYNYGYFK